jgi:hypothetical protein
MSEKISLRIFIVELILFAFPISLLLIFATIYQIMLTIDFFRLYNVANSLLALIACLAFSSGLQISETFIRKGSAELKKLKPNLWVSSLIGIVLLVAAGISILLHPSPEHSALAKFRNNFEYFFSGFPVFIPLLHLILERYFRKEKSST